MNLSEWAHSLENDEKAYVSQCFKYWQGHNGDNAPCAPLGISNARADILRYHTQSLMDTTTRRRKMEELNTITFKATKEFQQNLAMAAAEVDSNLSSFIRCCIELSIETVRKHPELIYTLKSVIPK